VVIVGTGNHWVIDALVGWMVIVLAWVAAQAVGRIPLPPPLRRRRTSDEHPSREDATVVD
jgi:hypothetical protein